MSNSRFTRTFSLLAATFIVATGLVPSAGIASTAGKRNTALILSGATVVSAVKGHKTAAVVLGAGSLYAWKRTADSQKQDRHKRAHLRHQSRLHSGRHAGWKHSKYYRGKGHK